MAVALSRQVSVPSDHIAAPASLGPIRIHHNGHEFVVIDSSEIPSTVQRAHLDRELRGISIATLEKMLAFGYLSVRKIGEDYALRFQVRLRGGGFERVPVLKFLPGRGSVWTYEWRTTPTSGGYVHSLDPPSKEYLYSLVGLTAVWAAFVGQIARAAKSSQFHIAGAATSGIITGGMCAALIPGVLEFYHDPDCQHEKKSSLHVFLAISALTPAAVGWMGVLFDKPNIILKNAGFYASGLMMMVMCSTLIPETVAYYLSTTEKQRRKGEALCINSAICSLTSAGIGLIGTLAGEKGAKDIGFSASALITLTTLAANVLEYCYNPKAEHKNTGEWCAITAACGLVSTGIGLVANRTNAVMVARLARSAFPIAGMYTAVPLLEIALNYKGNHKYQHKSALALVSTFWALVSWCMGVVLKYNKTTLTKAGFAGSSFVTLATLAAPDLEISSHCLDPAYRHEHSDYIYVVGAIRSLTAALIGLIGHSAGATTVKVAGLAISGLITSSLFTVFAAETRDCYRNPAQRGKYEGYAHSGAACCACVATLTGLVGYHAGATIMKTAGLGVGALLASATLAIPTLENTVNYRNPAYRNKYNAEIYGGGFIRALASACIGLLGDALGSTQLKVAGFAASGLITSSMYGTLAAETHDCYHNPTYRRKHVGNAYGGGIICAITSVLTGFFGHYAGATTAKVAGFAVSALTALGMCVASLKESPAPRRIT